MREFDDVWVWNSNPGEAFKVKEGVLILKTPLGKYDVACKGDPCNTTWDCCIKISNVPSWDLVPKDEPKKPDVKAGDLAYMDSHRFDKGLLRMVTGVNEPVLCKYSAISLSGDIVQWHKAELHTSAEDIEFMCNEAQVLSDLRAGKPQVGDVVWAWDNDKSNGKKGIFIEKDKISDCDKYPFFVSSGNETGDEWYTNIEKYEAPKLDNLQSKIGDEVKAWQNGCTGWVVGAYVNHTGSETKPYQVKYNGYTGFFDNIKLHPNNAPTVEEQLDSALAIFDEVIRKSDTLADLLDMALEDMKSTKPNAGLEVSIGMAILINSDIADLNSSLRDIRNGV